MRVDEVTKGGRREVVWSLLLSLAIAGAGTVYALRGADAVQIEQRGYMAQPDDLTPILELSDVVVEGEVLQVLPARWTTPDGRRPASLRQALNNPDAQLRTPVLVAVERVIKGEKLPARLLFTVPGGQDGAWRIRSEAAPDLAPGERIVAFLSEAPQDAGPWARIARLYPQMVFVEESDGKMRGPLKAVERLDFERGLRGGIER